MSPLLAIPVPGLSRCAAATRPAPVPGLTRDLVTGLRRGPGSSPEQAPGSGPGRDLPFGNHAPSRSGHGAFRVYHGVAPWRCALYRANRQPAPPHRGTSCGTVGAYRKIPDQNAGLVRTVRRFRNVATQGTRDQTLAAGLEDRADHSRQPRLAGHDRAYPGLRAQTAPVRPRGAVARQPAPVPGLTRDLVQSGGCPRVVREVPAQGRDGLHSADVLMYGVVEMAEVVE